MGAPDHNLSTDHQREGDARRPNDTLDRGQTPGIGPGGEAVGSGADAGGGAGANEDHDRDPQAGGSDRPVDPAEAR